MKTAPPSPSKEAAYDASEWPIFVVTSPHAVLSASETKAHMQRITELAFARREPFVLLLDARGAPRPDAVQRRLTAEEMTESGRRFPGMCLGVGIVISSALERGIVKAITWLAAPRYPTDAFENLIDAKIWARELIAKAKYRKKAQ